MEWIIHEKGVLSSSIGWAKADAGIDIDAAIETNKCRQRVHSAIKTMLMHTPKKRMEQGRGYKFNAEGNQTPYCYDVEVVSEEAYDREKSRTIMRSVIGEADKTSAEIDAALINTKVDYEPRFDVNESFEDIIAEFISDLK